MSQGRIRVSGTLSWAPRGALITTVSDEVWVVEGDEVSEALIGMKVTVEGVITGLDRLHADWIGADSQIS